MHLQARLGDITPGQSSVVKHSKTPIAAPKQRNPSRVGLCYIRALSTSIRFLNVRQHSSERMFPLELHACRLHLGLDFLEHGPKQAETVVQTFAAGHK